MTQQNALALNVNASIAYLTEAARGKIANQKRVGGVCHQVLVIAKNVDLKKITKIDLSDRSIINLAPWHQKIGQDGFEIEVRKLIEISENKLGNLGVNATQ